MCCDLEKLGLSNYLFVYNETWIVSTEVVMFAATVFIRLHLGSKGRRTSGARSGAPYLQEI